MANENDPVRPIPDMDDPSMEHEVPPGMDPAQDPADTEVERPEDWEGPALDDEDIPAPNEPTPLSDDRR